MHRLRLKLLWLAAFAAGLGAAGPALAGVLAPPLLGEFGKAIPGSSSAFIGFAAARENQYYGPDGAEFGVGGSSTNVEFVAAGMGWSDNWFSATPVPFLKDRTQSCAFIVSAARIQDDGASVKTAHALGLNAGSNQIGNPSFGCAVNDRTRRIGQVKGHLQFGTTVQVPVGGFEADNLYNLGTRYWTVIPKLALHAEWGRLITDSFVAYQLNSDASEVATLGLTPTSPADWRSAALNIGYRLTPRWMADIGYSYNASAGSNQYDKVDVHNAAPVGVDSCVTYGLPPNICASAAAFWYQSRPGPYTDTGVMVQSATASVYYTYRSSLFVVFRATKTLAGRSGNFTGNFDLCAEQSCGPANAISQFSGPITAASVASGTVYALTLVFPVGAP